MGWRLIRMLAAVLGAVAASLFILLAVTFPFDLTSQAAINREYLEQFQSAQNYVDDRLEKTGQLPANLEGWAFDKRSPVTIEIVNPAACDGGFKLDQTDRYMLGLWRGEWEECYASPSGRHTLLLSTSALLQSGLWRDWALYVLIGFGAAIIAWKVWPRRIMPAF